jgi:ribose 5-phosphate isomerase A
MEANAEDLKRSVGRYAADLIVDGMKVGLGTGSTVRHLLEAIGQRLARKELTEIVGVPTSEDTRRRATALGIPLGDLGMYPELDLAVDGADEFDPSLDLIKGLGGALLREKIVVTASRRFIAMVDPSKQVGRLGTRVPLPVEVDPFSLGMQIPFLKELGARPQIRMEAEGTPFRTDGGNLILDCHFAGGILDPWTIAAELDGRAGVLEHGLFLGVTECVLVGREEGVEVLRSEAAV